MCGVALRDVTSERVNYTYSPSKKKKWRVQARKFCSVLPQNFRNRIVSNCVIHGSDMLFLEKGCNRHFPEGLMLRKCGVQDHPTPNRPE